MFPSRLRTSTLFNIKYSILLFPSETSDEASNPSTPKLNRERERLQKHAQCMRNYRQRLKGDPEKYTLYREKEAARKRIERKKPKSEEKKDHEREMARIREQRRRLKLKEQRKDGVQEKTKPEKPQKPLTRKETEKKRTYNRIKKAEQRAKLSPQQKQIQSRKNKDYHKRKQIEKTIKSLSNPTTPTGEVVFTTDTTSTPKLGHIRQAAFRAKKKLPVSPQLFASTIGHLVKNATPRKQKQLELIGLGKDRMDMKARLSKYVTSLRTTMRRLLQEKNEKSLKKRRWITNSLSNVKQSQLYNDLGLSKSFLRKTRRKQDCDRKVRSDTMCTSIRDRVQAFYNREDNCQPVAEMKLLNSLEERSIISNTIPKLFNQYKNEYPHDKIGLTKFKMCRPKNILTTHRAKYLQCKCEYCENVIELLIVYNKYCLANNLKTSVIEDKYALVNLMVCKVTDQKLPVYACAYRQCGECSSDITINEKLSPVKSSENNDRLINWLQWKSVRKEYLTKSKELKLLSSKEQEIENGNIRELCDLLLEKAGTLTGHLFTTTMQSKYYQEVKSQPNQSLVLVSDFAENYTTFYQREISAVHFSRNQITVHPIVSFYKCQNDGCSQTKPVQENILCVSDDLTHDFHAVNTFQVQAVKYLRETRNLHFDNIKEFSDGCVQQFKSRNTFNDISYSHEDFGVERERNFFSSNHGKSECDSAGGVFKVSTKKAVLWQKAKVNCARDMYQYAVDNLTKKATENDKCNHHRRCFLLINNIDHDRDRNATQQVTSIRQLHQVSSTDQTSKVRVRHCSCMCKKCISGTENQCLFGIRPSLEVQTAKTSETRSNVKDKPSIRSKSDTRSNVKDKPTSRSKSVNPSTRSKSDTASNVKDKPATRSNVKDKPATTSQSDTASNVKDKPATRSNVKDKPASTVRYRIKCER